MSVELHKMGNSMRMTTQCEWYTCYSKCKLEQWKYNDTILIQVWTRGGKIRQKLRSQTIAVLPRRAAMIRMVWVILTPLTVNYIPIDLHNSTCPSCQRADALADNGGSVTCLHSLRWTAYPQYRLGTSLKRVGVRFGVLGCAATKRDGTGSDELP